MTGAIDRAFGLPAVQRTLLVLVASSVLVLLVLRGVHLDADFPVEVSRSGMIYTDEGWWSNAAVAHTLTGSWWVEGDYNPAVAAPVFQLSEALSFWAFGVSAPSARIVPILYFIALVTLAGTLARRHVGAMAGWLVALLLASDWMLFAFSRVVLLDLPSVTLSLAAILAADWTRGRSPAWIACLVAPLLAAAILTKATAVFAVPVCAAALVLGERASGRRVLGLGVLAATLGALLLAYYASVGRLFAEDLAYFASLNVGTKLGEVAQDPLAVLVRSLSGLRRLLGSESGVYVPAFSGIVLLWLWDGEFRRNDAVRLCLIWMAAYGALLGLTRYHPVRYLVPMLVPMLMLAGMGVAFAWRRRRVRALVALWVALAVISSVVRIGSYLVTPPRSFAEMAEDVGRRIRADPTANPVLLGHFANQVGLFAGIRSLNDQQSAREVDWKLRAYEPSWFIALGLPAELPGLTERRIEHVASYTVYGATEPVSLYRLRAVGAPAIDRR